MRPITTRRNHGPTLTKSQRAAFVALPICILLWIAASRIYSSPSFAGAGCLVSHGTYSGSIYAKPPETLGDKCLVESPWMRLAQHTVRLPPSGEGGNGKVVDDWLWIDYHDRINVLVEAPPRPAAADAAAATENDASQREEKSFIIISQAKYALPNELSLAVVGGIIEPGEEVLTAAQREVREELKVTCRNWKVLGNKFRTDVNRGMGWVHPYLARDCTYSSDANTNEENGGENVNTNEIAEVGGRDTERQQIRIMKLSEVKRAVMDGKFVEVQWSNTVALSMLHLSSLEEGD